MKTIVTDQKERIAQWAGERLSVAFGFKHYNAIGLEEDGRLVAAVVYDNWYNPGICAHIVSDGTRRWANRAFLKAIFDYPFNHLRCERITAPVAEGNAEAIRFVERLGFVLEGRLRRAMPGGSARLLYGILKGECRWI